ncbi:hypothetical protein JXA88_00020, partial [Candidatus Fermentibacteria bacterium]|nr:hypothetical protein [Candidatus Fermentibacteria bacterium]
MKRPPFLRLSMPAKRSALLVTVIAQWALYLWMALDPLTGSWCPFNPDTSYTLATARSWVHG